MVTKTISNSTGYSEVRSFNMDEKANKYTILLRREHLKSIKMNRTFNL